MDPILIIIGMDMALLCTTCVFLRIYFPSNTPITLHNIFKWCLCNVYLRVTTIILHNTIMIQTSLNKH